jgi:hypothetical protein
VEIPIELMVDLAIMRNAYGLAGLSLLVYGVEHREVIGSVAPDNCSIKLQHRQSGISFGVCPKSAAAHFIASLFSRYRPLVVR